MPSANTYTAASITAPTSALTDISISKDGSCIAIGQAEVGNSLATYRKNSSGTFVRRTNNYGGALINGVAVSHDGEFVYAAQQSSTGAAVFRWNSTSNTYVLFANLTETSNQFNTASFIGTTTELIVGRGIGEAIWYKIDPTAGTVTKRLTLTGLGSVRDTDVSPDGNHVCFGISGAGLGIYYINVAAGTLTSKYSVSGGAPGGSRCVNWSPDGTYIAIGRISAQDTTSGGAIVKKNGTGSTATFSYFGDLSTTTNHQAVAWLSNTEMMFGTAGTGMVYYELNAAKTAFVAGTIPASLSAAGWTSTSFGNGVGGGDGGTTIAIRVAASTYMRVAIIDTNIKTANIAGSFQPPTADIHAEATVAGRIAASFQSPSFASEVHPGIGVNVAASFQPPSMSILAQRGEAVYLDGAFQLPTASALVGVAAPVYVDAEFQQFSASIAVALDDNVQYDENLISNSAPIYSGSGVATVSNAAAPPFAYISNAKFQMPTLAIAARKNAELSIAAQFQPASFYAKIMQDVKGQISASFSIPTFSSEVDVERRTSEIAGVFELPQFEALVQRAMVLYVEAYFQPPEAALEALNGIPATLDAQFQFSEMSVIAGQAISAHISSEFQLPAFEANAQILINVTADGEFELPNMEISIGTPVGINVAAEFELATFDASASINQIAVMVDGVFQEPQFESLVYPGVAVGLSAMFQRPIMNAAIHPGIGVYGAAQFQTPRMASYVEVTTAAMISGEFQPPSFQATSLLSYRIDLNTRFQPASFSALVHQPILGNIAAFFQTPKMGISARFIYELSIESQFQMPRFSARGSSADLVPGSSVVLTISPSAHSFTMGGGLLFGGIGNIRMG